MEFNIQDAVNNIKGKAWKEVKESNVSEVWKQFCPDFTKDLQGFEDSAEDCCVTN
jgi:hypothetical protein